MTYVISVNQMVQLQVLKDGKINIKTLLPYNKYIVKDIKNQQIVDLKSVSLLKIRHANMKEESSCEFLELK